MRLWFAQGNFIAINQRIQDYRKNSGLTKQRAAVLIFPQETIDISLAYASLAEGKSDEAKAILEKIQRRAEKSGRTENLIECLLLQALVSQLNGNVPHTLSLLSRAVTLAEPEGFIRVFIDMGLPMAILLKEATLQGMATDYIRKLLVEFEKSKSCTSLPALHTTVEPLTAREIEVLRLIADDLSNKEIAQKLNLTLGTVKTHAHNIYAKLDVRNRTQAIKRATNLNLL